MNIAHVATAVAPMSTTAMKTPSSVLGADGGGAAAAAGVFGVFGVFGALGVFGVFGVREPFIICQCCCTAEPERSVPCDRRSRH